MRTTHHAVVALIFDLAVLDLQIMAVAHAADVILVTVVQFLGALVPGQSDLWVVDPDAALEGGALVLSCRLVRDVLHDRDRLGIQNQFELFHQCLRPFDGPIFYPLSKSVDATVW